MLPNVLKPNHIVEPQQLLLTNQGFRKSPKSSDTSTYLQVLNDFLINSATCCSLSVWCFTEKVF